MRNSLQELFLFSPSGVALRRTTALCYTVDGGERGCAGRQTGCTARATTGLCPWGVSWVQQALLELTKTSRHHVPRRSSVVDVHDNNIALADLQQYCVRVGQSSDELAKISNK